MRISALLLVAFIPALSNASLITATFSGQLTRVDDALVPQFSVGDPFSYSISYDDASPNISGSPDWSKFLTGPFVVNVNGYSASQATSFMWNAPDLTRILIQDDTSPLSGAPVSAAGPTLIPYDAGFRWVTNAAHVSADMPPANLTSGDFSSQRGIFTFRDQRSNSGSADIGVEVVFSSGAFTENPDGSISVNFTGEVVGKVPYYIPVDYDFLPTEFQSGDPFTLTAVIGAGQTDHNPADGEGTFFGENATFTSGTYFASISDLRVTTALDDRTGELEIRIQSDDSVVAPSVQTLTTASLIDMAASIIDDDLSNIFDFSVPMPPFAIDDVDLTGFGMRFSRGGGFDDEIGIIGISDSVVFEIADIPSPPALAMILVGFVVLFGTKEKRKNIG